MYPPITTDMGFGILFIGYFLLLNFAYFSFTDAIAGVIMLYGLYKLSFVNREFKTAAFISGGFTLLGIFELTAELLRMFSVIQESELLGSISAIIRVTVMGALTVYILLGIQSVAKEVGLSELEEKAGKLFILTFPVCGVRLSLEILGLFSLSQVMPLIILSVFSIVLSFTLTVLILIRIYSCYMRICMPADRDIDDKKKERGGFLGALEKHREEKEKEYADYRFEKYKKKMEKLKEKGKNEGNKKR